MNDIKENIKKKFSILNELKTLTLSCILFVSINSVS